MPIDEYGGNAMSENSLLPEQAPSMFGQPLAARMRPSSLDEIAGQQHLLGPGKVLRRLISSDSICSMIFWGPPGVGKTTLPGSSPCRPKLLSLISPP